MIAFILNLPLTVAGLLTGIISGPTAVAWKKKPYAIVLTVRRFWWVFGYMKNSRAMAIGHTVLLGPNVESRDLEHELVHVLQCARAPLIQPILYAIERRRKGYRNNKYEEEAYRIAGNTYYMKTLKFRSHLIPAITDGTKTSTWRLFDDKDLRVGDELEFVDHESKEKFARARIVRVREKKLGELNAADFEGHQTYENEASMLDHYRKYYGDRVSLNTPVKMIDFEILQTETAKER
jgi:hypothetical protein